MGGSPLRAALGLYVCAVLSADLRHFLDLPDDIPGPARRLAAPLGDLIRAATAAELGPAWISALPCRRRPGHRACPGRMMVRRPDRAAPIAFENTDCGDGGVFSGWHDSPDDGSEPQPPADLRRPGQADFHLAGRRGHPARPDVLGSKLRAGRVRGARRPRSRRLAVTEDELEELIESVGRRPTTNRTLRRRRRLDAELDSLETAALHGNQLTAVPKVTSSRAGGASARRRPGLAG